MKEAGLFIAGVVVGVLIGHYVWTAEEETKGLLPPPPSWADTMCPPPDGPGTVLDKCIAINTAANAAQPQTADSIYCASKSLQVLGETPADPAVRSGHVYAAWQHATAATTDWAACKAELDQE